MSLTASQILDSLRKQSSEIQRPMVKTDIDSLVLSCAWSRLKKTNNTNSNNILGIYSLTDNKLRYNVEPCDYELAEKVRNYFNGIITWKSLKGETLGKFRTDLSKYLTSDPNTFVDDFIPLIIKLPELYLDDVEFDNKTINANKKIKNFDPYQIFDKKLDLCLLYKYTKKRKLQGNKIEYWFTDQDNNLCKLALEPHNILMGVFDYLLDSNEKLSIMANCRYSLRDQVEYVSIRKFELLRKMKSQ